METEIVGIKKVKEFLSKNNIHLFQNFIFITILLGLLYLNKLNYYIFHSTAEIFSCIIAGGVLMISLSTYKITKNNFFMFLGIGHLFILTLDVFHTITFDNILASSQFVYDIDTRFWIAARYLELMTYSLSFIFLFKKNKKFNFYVVFFVYYAITLFLFFDIINFNKFIPVMRLAYTGITDSKIYLEYFAAIGFLICCLILYFARNKIDKSLYIFLEISLLLKVFTELLYTMHTSAADYYIVIGQLLKVISYYSLYLGIIVNGLERPFDMNKHNLDSMDNDLKKKENQRKYIEEIFYQNEQCYNWIINNSSSGIIIIRNNKLVYANETAINMVGAKDLQEIVGREVKEFLFDNTIDINNIGESSNTLHFNNLKLLKLNKDTLDVEYTIHNIIYRGTPAYLAMIKDTRLKKEINNLKNNLMENKIELNKSNEFNKVLTEFFSNISHDLKTPINVILSAVQLLILKQKNGITAEFIDQLNRFLIIIKQNGFRLIRLVNNLVDISKFESGFLKLELKNHNIVSIVEDITTSVGDYIKLKGVNITFDTDVEERMIAIDADKIERILLNLLSNAVKFTDIGDEIFVYIEDNDDFVKIRVKDTGVGIPEDKLKVIFDRFGQVEDTLTRNKDGSGIGLSLVKSLTEMHSGSIKVKSKVGEGSEFIVELPVRLTEECDSKITDNISNYNNIDKVLIEFSDIYSIN